MTLGYATVEDIMAVYRVSRSYVYKMASLKQWGRYRHPDKGVKYRWEDVADTLGRGRRTAA